LRNRLTVTCLAWLGRLKQLIEEHPKRIAAAAASTLLAGSSGTLVLGYLGPDPADLPVTTITHAVESLADDLPLSILTDLPHYSLYRSDTLKNTDTATTVLTRLGIVDAAAREFLERDTLVYQNMWKRTGRSLRAETTNDHRLLKLTARWVADDSGNFQRLIIERQGDDSFVSRLETAPLTVGTRLAGGTIRSSLFAATDAAGIPDGVAVQMAELFSNHIDFRRSLRAKDHFTVIYETLEADGEALGNRRVLSAQFHNKGNTYSAVWYQENDAENGAYYTLEGDSLRRAYLATPVKFTRITSDFGPRIHPIHKNWRVHKGTDMAAPSGTPVRTVGDGEVQFAGTQNGYGKVVYIKHRNKDVTVYAHLSRIGVKKGQRVMQGQEIGAVGMTGWATGPHLHFEFRVDGIHKDPMTIARQSEAAHPIAQSARADFDRLASHMRLQLDLASRLQVADATGH